MDETVVLRGIPIQRVTESQCVEHLIAESVAGRGGWLVTVNTDILRRYERDASFRDLVASATRFVADGMPLVWASRIQGTPLPERVAGSSLLFSISAAAASARRSVFLLGGNLGTASAASERLRALSPSLQVAGTHYPPHGFMDDQDQMQMVRSALADTRPDIVFVGLPCPLQERLIASLAPLSPGTWWIGVGVSFSFACGEIERAPLWMQRLSLEWLHRLSREPRRLASRYLRDDLPYALALLAEAGTQRLRR